MTSKPPVAIIMGSQSDWPTMKHAAETLDALEIGYEALIISAHRTPERMYDFAKTARANGFKTIIAGAGGAAHLPGMTASLTTLPVFGVPVQSRALSGQDSLLSIVQMPAGIVDGGQLSRMLAMAAARRRRRPAQPHAGHGGGPSRLPHHHPRARRVLPRRIGGEQPHHRSL